MNDECWLEMDLYWFQGAPPEQRAVELVDRLRRLWTRSSGARKGLSLCVGWLYDTILAFNGRMDDVIPTCQPPTYEPWTYRRFAELIAIVKAEAARQGVGPLHVALMVIGVPSMEVDECEGFSGRTEQAKEKAGYHIASPWFKAHPEVRDDRFDLFYFGAAVNVPHDEAVCREPHPTFGSYFADKLCSLAEHVGLDAIVLRDAIFSPAYVRGSRRGRYADPGAARDWTDSFATLLARIKSNRPQLITIGYNSGISPVEEWRSHGFDLERLARSGNLDMWITQTWGSAWQDYWPQQSGGFTFQLANVLLNLAMLEPTPCRHMFLIEAFDAWEPWDSIHQYPSKVAWEIWAYSHAAMLRGDQPPARPGGCYISWMNRRRELLPRETVDWLVGVMTDAAEDLARNPVPAGPCLVFDRAAMELSLSDPTDTSRGEELDDWSAMLLKSGCPILSITRAEYAAATRADAYILPSVISPSLVEWIVRCAESGTPVLTVGEASHLPDALRRSLTIALESSRRTAPLPTAAVVSPELASSIGTAGLTLCQRRRTLAASSGWATLITALDGPVFARHRSAPFWIWETPEWGTPLELNVTTQTIQSPQTSVAVAQCFRQGGWGAARVNWSNQDWLKPVCLLVWNYPTGESAVLLGNLETGVTGNSQNCAKGTLSFDRAGFVLSYGDDRYPAPGRVVETDGQTVVSLGPHKVARVHLEKRTARQ